MKPTYSDINITTGAYYAGIYKILIAPREWLTDTIVTDFATNTVVNEILLIDGKEFLQLELAPESYDFEEKPKSTKGGSYLEVTVQGTLNDITPEILSILETFRYHEMVAILYDKRRRLKVVGNKDAGLLFRYGNKEDGTKQGGVQTCAIDMTMDSEKGSPFYVFK